jgi:hypothetical protein
LGGGLCRAGPPTPTPASQISAEGLQFEIQLAAIAIFA